MTTAATLTSMLDQPNMNNFIKESENNQLEEASLQSLSFASSLTSILKKQASDSNLSNTKKRTSPGNTTSTLISQEATEENDEQQQQQPKKKKTKKARKWQKPKDKPKRPLSSYNLFFADERQKMIDERDAAANVTKSTNKKSTGFGNMAKTIGDKWNVLDDASRSVYEQQAKKEKQKYFIAIEEWKLNKAKKEKEIEEKNLSTQMMKVNSLPSPPKKVSLTEPTHPTNSLIEQMHFVNRQQLQQQKMFTLPALPKLPTFPFTSTRCLGNGTTTTAVHTTSHRQQQQAETSLGDMLSGWFDDLEAEEDEFSNGAGAATCADDIFGNDDAMNADLLPTPFACSSNNAATDTTTTAATATGGNMFDEEDSSQLLSVLSDATTSASSSSNNNTCSAAYDNDDSPSSQLNRMLETSLELLERSRAMGTLSALDNDESCSFLSALDYTVPTVLE